MAKWRMHADSLIMRLLSRSSFLLFQLSPVVGWLARRNGGGGEGSREQRSKIALAKKGE